MAWKKLRFEWYCYYFTNLRENEPFYLLGPWDYGYAYSLLVQFSTLLELVIVQLHSMLSPIPGPTMHQSHTCKPRWIASWCVAKQLEWHLVWELGVELQLNDKHWISDSLLRYTEMINYFQHTKINLGSWVHAIVKQCWELLNFG